MFCLFQRVVTPLGQKSQISDRHPPPPPFAVTLTAISDDGESEQALPVAEESKQIRESYNKHLRIYIDQTL